MNDKTYKLIVKKCGTCEAGGLEFGNPECFHPYHRGRMGGWGTEWAAYCPDFKDTGKIGTIERKCVVKR